MSIDLLAAKDLLRRTGWLAHVPEDFRERFLAGAKLRRYVAGEPIYHLGDSPRGLFGLVRGGVRITMAPDRLGPYPIHIARVGFWIGQAPLLSGGRVLVGLEATRDTVMLHVPVAHVDAMLRDDPGGWRWLGLLSVEHAHALMLIVDDLMRRDARARIIAILLRLAGLRPEGGAPAAPTPVDLTQEGLAEMANVSRNTLGTYLRELETAGLIELSYRRIHILDPSALEEILDRHDA